MIKDISHVYEITSLRGRCESLPYEKQVLIRYRRLEALDLASTLHTEAGQDGHITFWEKRKNLNILNSVYSRHTLLYFGLKD